MTTPIITNTPPAAAAAVSDFANLLDELTGQAAATTDMAKALEAAIVAEAPKPKKGEAGYVEDAGEISKSFQVTLESGEVTQAVDATDMLKALNGDMIAVRKVIPALAGVVKTHGDMLKSLSAEFANLRTQGTGRRSTLTVAEKAAPAAASGDMAKAGTMTPGEFMLKASVALADNKITGAEAGLLDAYVGRGQQPPDELVIKVLGAS